MSAYDVIVCGATVVTETGLAAADVAIADGCIAAIEPELSGRAGERIRADGLHVLPGAVDGHVHLNEPGRADWEGFETGTRALAAGGATVAVDMPLNSVPPTIDTAAFDAKRRCGERSAHVDFALWGGIVPGGLEAMDELAARGVVGFKAFMCDSGVEEFPRADDLTLYEGMQRAAALGLPVAVHAESHAITRGLAARAIADGRAGMRDYLASRPTLAETEAIARALLIAREAGCAVHVAHVSTGRGVALVAEARAGGVDASCETCPHYLVFDDDDAERLGTLAKCAPPLRPPAEREALWRALVSGTLPMVASDHSPAPTALKSGDDAHAAWGGISGAQTTLPLLLTHGHNKRGIALDALTAATASFPARRLRLARKGHLRLGADADLTLVDLDARWRLREDELLYRHPSSPFVGCALRARVTRTLVRGKTVFADGLVVGEPRGQLVKPEATIPREGPCNHS